MLETEFEPSCEGSGREKDLKTRVWLPLCAMAVLLVAVAGTTTEEQSVPETQAPVPAASAAGDDAITPPGVGGLKTYRDPLTGERRSPPPGVVFPALTPAERNARSRSHEGLEEVRGATPEDGFMVDLKGRFHSAVVSVRQQDESYTTRCLNEVPHATRGE